MAAAGRPGRERQIHVAVSCRGLACWVVFALLAGGGGEAAALGFTVRAQAHPQVYAPAYESSTVVGNEALAMTGAAVAERSWTEGDALLETNSFRVTSALAMAGPPKLGGGPIDLGRGFAHAMASSSVELQEMVSPWTGGNAWPIWGSQAHAESSYSSDWVVGNPAVSATMPIEIGFAFSTGRSVTGGQSHATTLVSGAFYIDDEHYYSFSLSESTAAAPNVLINYMPGSQFDIEPFRYEEGRSKESYLTLKFEEAPAGRYRFDLTASVFATNGLENGDTLSRSRAWATIDPFIRVDPTWEYADLVQTQADLLIDYDGNPLAGTDAEAFWAEYDSSVVPEPGTGLLVAFGVSLLAWSRRPRALAAR